MTSHLTYRPREGIVVGVVAGKPILAATLRTQLAMDAGARRAAARPGETAHGTTWDHQYDFRPGKWTIVDCAGLEVFDYPGEFAQRFDGMNPGGGSSSHRQHARVVWVKSAPRRGVPIHGPPACGNPSCIVIALDWDSVFHALREARRVSLVVEL
jgi:hypothetical protein